MDESKYYNLINTTCIHAREHTQHITKAFATHETDRLTNGKMETYTLELID